MYEEEEILCRWGGVEEIVTDNACMLHVEVEMKETSKTHVLKTIAKESCNASNKMEMKKTCSACVQKKENVT